MKKFFYIVVAAAALLFIGDWLLRNYQAYAWAKDGTERLTSAISMDSSKTKFPICRRNTMSDRSIINACDQEQAAGYVRFAAKWWSPETRTDQKLGMISCWQSFSDATSNNWSMSAMCASGL